MTGIMRCKENMKMKKVNINRKRKGEFLEETHK